MATPENPFDQTVWDPVDPEHAIEDPLHGPSATNSLLEIPPMRLEDGTFYQPGGFYAFGTVYIDAQGQPIHKIGISSDTAALMREQMAVSEWIEQHTKGTL